jgi:predicted glycosyltransferase
MVKSLIESFERLSLKNNYEIILIPDPYLERERVKYIKEKILPHYIRIIPFTFNFVDLMNYAELVISRGGYNTVNELLLTGSKALIIPESHPSREQERRVSILPEENIIVKSEDDVISERQDNIITELLKREKKILSFENNKYTAGLKIIEDLEKWAEKKFIHKT